jgi:hypothetical protein
MIYSFGSRYDGRTQFIERGDRNLWQTKFHSSTD